MVTAAAILLGITLVSGEPIMIPSEPGTIAAIAYLAVLGTVVLFGACVYALTRWTASAVSYSTLLMPLVTVPLAALLAGETVSLWLLLGGAIILAGVYVGAFLRRPRRWSASSLRSACPSTPVPSRRPRGTRAQQVGARERLSIRSLDASMTVRDGHDWVERRRRLGRV